jgi:uncharacterized repeat protein (TIGR01451 family)
MQVRPTVIKLRLHVFLMLLAIAGGVALALFSNSAVNHASAQNNELDKIVFGQNGQILVVNPDGSGLVPFGAGFDPSWSTTDTGQGKIAFGFGPSELTRIAIMNEDGSNVVQLIPEDFATRTSQPALSPDATKVALVNEVLETDPGEPAQAVHSRIYIVAADGQNLRPLFTGGVSSGVAHENAPAWSPDGTRIAFIGRKADGASDLYVVDANGQAPPFRITNLGDTLFSFGQLSWSPDGQRLAFSYAQNIHAVNTDGSGGLINLTNSTPGSEKLEPAWSPDGQKIAYSSDDTLHVMDANGQNQISLNIAGREPSWRWRTVTPEPGPSPTPSADVVVTLSATSGAVLVGQNLTYTMTVRNNGNSSAENVEATLLRSASLEFVSVTPAQGSCDPNGNPVTCQLGQLAPSAQTSIRFTFRPTVVGEVVAIAGAQSPTHDPNLNNNSQRLALTVGQSCVPEVTSLVQHATLRLGSQNARTVRHLILMRNNSGRALNGNVHVVFDGLPGSIQSGDPGNPFFSTQCASPLGRKYMTLRLNNGTWQPGQIIFANVEFFNPQRVRVSYRLRVHSGSGTP